MSCELFCLCFLCFIVIQRSFATKDLEYTHFYVHETLRFALSDTGLYSFFVIQRSFATKDLEYIHVHVPETLR